MTDDLYERYKEALRVGHVAVLRGELEEALQAYRTAAAIAPSRALPHTSLGGVLLRLGHLEDALVEYAAAVARAPHDEGALLGQAEALTIAGQRNDAALTLDHVAEIQEASGRLPEAADTLRRALELDDGPERARHQRGLLREIRLSAGDQAAEQMLARALRLRDTTPAAGSSARMPASTVAGAGLPLSARLGLPAARQTPVEPGVATQWDGPVAAAETEATPEPSHFGGLTDESASARSGPLAAEMANVGFRGEPVDEDRLVESRQSRDEEASQATADFEPAAESEPEDEEPVLAGAAAEMDDAADGDEGAADEEVEPAGEPVAAGAAVDEAPVLAEPVLAAVGVMDGAFDTGALLGTVGESEHQPTGDELLSAAEAADLAGDNTTLRSLLLWTARAYAREGRFEAGLDATHRLLQRAPGDVDAHLVLVELYMARDWNSLAADKLVLLGRLADLDNDTETKQRLCAVAARAFPGDERLAALYG